MVPELDHALELKEEVASRWSLVAWIATMEALGIPGEVLSKSGKVVLEVAQREMERHRSRLPTVSPRADNP